MMYQDMVSDRLSAPPIMFLQCSQPECTAHACLLDDYANHIVSTLLDCAFCCFPSKSSSSRRVRGWNDSAAKLKEASILWHRIWTEAGCPSAGVLSTIKNHAKRDTSTRFAVSSIDRNIDFVVDWHIRLQ